MALLVEAGVVREGIHFETTEEHRIGNMESLAGAYHFFPKHGGGVVEIDEIHLGSDDTGELICDSKYADGICGESREESDIDVAGRVL